MAARDDLLAKADALDDEALEASGAKQDELRKRAAGLRVEALGAKPYPVLVCASCYDLTGWLDDDGVCATDAMRRLQDSAGGFVDVRDDRPRYEDAPAPAGRRIARALGLGRRRDRTREWLEWIEPGETGPVDPEEGWEIEAPLSFERPAPSGPHLLVHFDTQSLRFEDGAWRPADTTRGRQAPATRPARVPGLARDRRARGGVVRLQGRGGGAQPRGVVGGGEAARGRRRSGGGAPPGRRDRERDERAAALMIYAITRYTWNTSAYSRFTLIPCVRARLRTYSGSA